MIFVAIAAYCDPELTHTIWDCRTKASQPVVFGVVDQSDLPGYMGPDVRYVHVRPQHSHGLGWARSQCFALYRGEDYLLQVDSHTLFEQDWDQTLIEMLSKLPAKPILSSYPMPYTIKDGQRFPQVDRAIQAMQIKDGEALKPHDPQITFKSLRMESPVPVRSIHLAGGFVFTRGAFVEEVPYDPYLYFRDEQAMATRAFTHGWDIWNPPNVPLYHLYKQDDLARPVHWDPGQEHDGPANEIRARDRLVRLFYGAGLPSYGLGNARTLDDWARFSGIDYRNRVLRT